MAETGRLAAKVKTPTSVAGNSAALRPVQNIVSKPRFLLRFLPLHVANPAVLRAESSPGARAKGFTLLELMVVVAVIAVGAAGVALALRDGSQTALEREADRLAAVLDAARAQSRASGARLSFRATPEGFLIEGLPNALPQAWLTSGVQAQANGPVLLGPEPIIEPSRITLVLGEQSRVVSTDGLLPFRSQGGAGE